MESQLNIYWEKVLLILEESEKCTPVVMDNMIKILEPLYMRNNFFVLKCPTAFHKETIERRYLIQIENTLREVTNNNIQVRIVAPDELNSDFDITQDTVDKNKIDDVYTKYGLINKYIFDTFVKGKSNELAYSAAVAVANSPGQTYYNPLFLYGGVGLGKTHLMHSIGNRLLEIDSSKKILYCSSETFTNELISSIKNHKNQEFRKKYREIDILLIDDIQFLSEKEGTQEEFFHTFNALYGDNKQIVISSDQPPKDLITLEQRLTSRFGSGLIVDITLPDFETRTAILEKKSDLENIVVSKEVTKFIAKNVVSNIRDLEGALNKVTAYARLSNAVITLELAETALKDIITGAEKPELTVEYIQEVTAGYFNITVEDLKGPKRNQSIVVPRQIAMYLAHKLKDISLPALGKKFGGRDHSTVIHSCDKIENEIETNITIRNTVIELEKKVKGI